MEILIKKNKNQLYRLLIGRDMPHCQCSYLISIVLEDYDNNLTMTYATFIKGWFKKKGK